MLTFRLFGFPVRIQWMFWLLCLFLGMNYLREPGPQSLGMFLMMTAVVLGSIVWHELGHAWARKKSGAPYSEITLHGFGGLCGGPGQFTRGESIFIAAAGPAASLLLGGLTWLLYFTPGMANMWIQVFVGQMLWVNVGWAILNLLPIVPLDGGRIFEGIAGPRNRRLVSWVGLLIAAALAVLGLVSGWLFAGILFGLLAYSNWQHLQGQRSRYF
ncbi:MAG: M50 family metallopeptidase [Verrucomicrobiales bacterium]